MSHIHLPHQKPNEKVIMTIRRHPIIIFGWFVFWAFIMILPLVMYYFFGQTIINLFNSSLFEPIGILFASIFYLFIWLLVLNTFVNYYLDVWIITNERIVNVEQKQIFHRVASEHKLVRIQDVTSELKGIFGTFLDYGEVFIQTAGQKERFIFRQVPHPADIARKCIQLSEQRKHYEKIKDQGD